MSEMVSPGAGIPSHEVESPNRSGFCCFCDQKLGFYASKYVTYDGQFVWCDEHGPKSNMPPAFAYTDG